MLNRLCEKYAVTFKEAKAPDKYVGIYAIPGKDLQYARDNGNIALFDSELEAVEAAAFDLCDALNQRARSKNKSGYVKMGGNELAIALGRMNLHRIEFARLVGSDPKRVTAWIDGEIDIPHSARILAALFADQRNLELARQLTDAFTYDKRNDDKEETT